MHRNKLISESEFHELIVYCMHDIINIIKQLSFFNEIFFFFVLGIKLQIYNLLKI